MNEAALAEAFRLLQGGDAPGALRAAAEIVAAEPGNARAYLAAGIALRALRRWDEARGALEHAARLAPGDYAAPYELGLLLEQLGQAREAVEQYERSIALRPQFAAALFAAGRQKLALRDWQGAAASFEAVVALQPDDARALANLGQALAGQARNEAALTALQRAIEANPADAAPRYAMGWALDRMGRGEEAFARYEEALACDSRHFEALRALGRHCVRRADYARAGGLFGAAAAIAPHDPDLPLYLAQVLLLLGRWEEAWAPYARRDSRVAFEAQAAAAGRPYRPPSLADLNGREVALIGEQGLGDILFFLRYAPALRPVVRRLAFAGERRLHSILERTGAIDATSESPAADALPLLVADLPAVLGASCDVFAPSLRAAPRPERIEAWERRLAAAGPRPWIAATWQTGTPRALSREALSKSIGVSELFRALAPLGGTVFALQRAIEPDELERAREALGGPVHDLSDANADLEDLLAVVSLVDRHVAVSSTNMHLAALAGAAADVLVPFPPEWRWRPDGDSPWFPGFRVHRQARDGDWSRALAAIRDSAQANDPRASS